MKPILPYSIEKECFRVHLKEEVLDKKVTLLRPPMKRSDRVGGRKHSSSKASN